MPIEIIFKGENEELNPTLEVFATDENKIFLRIKYEDDSIYECRCISLNKFDAAKLAKEIRKQISFLED
jgi:hypothetical protein